MTDFIVYNSFVSKAEDSQGNYFRKHLGDRNFLVLGKASKIQTDYFNNNDGSYSLKYTCGGKEYYQFKNKLVATSFDRYLLTNPNSRYVSYINQEKNIDAIYVFFSSKEIKKLYTSLVLSEGELLDDPLGSREEFRFQETLYKLDSNINFLLSKLPNIVSQTENKEEVTSYLYSLMEQLVLNQEAVKQEHHKINATKKSTKEEVYKRLYIAKDYIDSCYDENISVRELAKMAYMCEHHFLRRFKSFFKITPYQYLSKRRVEQAQELLLKNKDQTISSISLELGFENVTSFNRCFKKHVQMSPSLYRVSKGF